MASYKVGDTVKVRNCYERFWVVISSIHKGLTDTVYAATVENQLIEDMGYNANDTIYFTETDIVDSEKNKELIKEQFGSDYGRFIKQKDEFLLQVADSELAEQLRELIAEGNLYMCDKDSCTVWKASNIVGWKNGLLILHPR